MRLDEIVSEMDSGKAELDKLLSLFEEGTALVKQCKKELDSAERKVKLVTEAGETNFPIENYGYTNSYGKLRRESNGRT